VLKKSLFLS